MRLSRSFKTSLAAKLEDKMIQLRGTVLFRLVICCVFQNCFRDCYDFGLGAISVGWGEFQCLDTH